MKLTASILLSLIGLQLCGFAQRERPDGRKSDDPNTWVWSIPDAIAHVTHGTVYSEAMKREVGYNIYLPPSYKQSPKRRYSVVYFLHGAGGDEKTAGNQVEIVLPEMEAGTIEEAIFVFVNGGHWSIYRDSKTSYVKAESYLIKELIPAIDDRYRTINHREGRAIFGFSMGGGGSLRLGLKYPELFCAVGSFSGALDWARDRSGKSMSAKEVYPEDNIYYWATKHRDEIKDKMGLYLTVGGSEWLYDDHPPFLAHLRELEIGFDYSVQGDLGHNLGKSKELFGSKMIQFLGCHFKAPE